MTRHVPLQPKIALPRPYESIVRDLLFRLLLIIALMLLTACGLWLDRAGLRDNANPGQPIDFLAVVYYAVVTLTTVGYGDITPVTDTARLINILFVAPIRVVILIIFVGTAYELVLQRYQEAYRMRRLQMQLREHTIVCGYGVKGRASVAELLSYGIKQNQIVVIDIADENVEAAANEGIAALRGDATSEAVLRAAAIEKAAHVIVDVDKDDTAVLICLTTKHLNAAVQVVAAAKEAENIPLLYRSGADVVVASAVSSGRMLAMATRQQYAPRFVEDIITFGRGMDIGERTIRPEEDGLPLRQLPDLADKLVLGAYHEDKSYAFNQLSDLRLHPGDIIVYLASKP
ncbi:MAG: potassium channel family protein [Armatimonadota bacterium]